MEKLYTERKAIQEYLEFLREERRRISSEYWRALQRLKELDEQINKHEPTELINTLVSIIETQTKTLNHIKELIPNIPLELAVEKINRELERENLQAEEIEEEEQTQTITTTTVKRKRKRAKVDEVAKIVAKYLRESELPKPAGEIEKYLTDKGYKVYPGLLTKLVDTDKNIVRVKRGYYKYEL